MNFANLGIAMGAGVDEYHKQLDSNLKQTQEARAAEQFEWQKAQQERQRRIQGEQDALMKEFADLDNYYKGAAGVADDQLGEYIKSGMDKYNNHPLYKNGMFANVTNVDGRPMIVHGNMAKLGGVQMMPVDRKTLDEGYNHMRSMLMERLAATDPALYQQRFDKDRDFGVKTEEVGLKRQEVADKGAYYRGSLEVDNKRADRPTITQDGTGRVLAISPDGRLLGTFGNPRPILGHGGGSGDRLTDEQASMLNQAMQYEEIAKQLGKSNPTAAQQYRNAAIRTMDGLPSRVQLQFRGKFGNPPQDIDPWELPAKVKRVDPKTGAEIEAQVPMRVADPEGYAKYKRGLAYENMGSVFGEQPAQSVAPQGTGLPWISQQFVNYADRVARDRVRARDDEEDRLSRGGR